MGRNRRNFLFRHVSVGVTTGAQTVHRVLILESRPVAPCPDLEFIRRVMHQVAGFTQAWRFEGLIQQILSFGTGFTKIVWRSFHNRCIGMLLLSRFAGYRSTRRR